MCLVEPARDRGFRAGHAGIAGDVRATDLDVAGFFVLRRYRRSGVGRQATRLMWDGLGGNWVVRVSDANRAGLPVWRDVVREYTGDHYAEALRSEHPHGWTVFTFASHPSE